MPSGGDSFEQKTACFEQFLKSKGVAISPKVAIADFRSVGQGRGLVALEDIEQGETLFKIPQSAFLRSDEDPELRELIEKFELDSWSALIVRMIAVQTSEEWKPYFDVLPTQFNTPMFWDPRETAELLKGSDVMEKIGREDADELYDELAKTILKEPYFAEVADKSREAFHRMGSLIMSYAFDVKPSKTGENEDEDEDEDEDDEAKAMIPLADILNSHTKLQNAQLTVPEESDGNYEMVASKTIRKGEQIYNIYGNQPSGDMLRRYGFVESGGTSFEVVELRLELLQSVASHVLELDESEIDSRVEALADRMGDLPSSFEVGLTFDEEIEDPTLEVEFEPELLITANALTIENLGKKEFKQIVNMVEEQLELYPKARSLLLEAVKSRRSQYGEIPRNLLQPEREETQVLLSKEAMCAQVRAAEVRVLDMAADWLAEEDSAEPQPKKQKH